MTIQAQLPSFSPPPATPNLLDTLGLKSGQSVAATVIGTTPNGQTQLEVGGQVLSLSLPQPIPTGTVVQLRAEGSGPNLQLTLTVQAPPGPAPQTPAPPQMPQQVLVQLLPQGMPPAGNVVLPQPPVVLPQPSTPQSPVIILPHVLPTAVLDTRSLATPAPITPASPQPPANTVPATPSEIVAEPPAPSAPASPPSIPSQVSPSAPPPQPTQLPPVPPSTPPQPSPGATPHAPASPAPASTAAIAAAPAAPESQATPAAIAQVAAVDPQAQPAVPAQTSAPARGSAAAPPQLPIATSLPVTIAATGQSAHLLIVGKVPAEIAPASQTPLAQLRAASAAPAPASAQPQLPAGTVLTVRVPGSNQTGQLLILGQSQPVAAALVSQSLQSATTAPGAASIPAQPTPGTVLKIEVQIAGRPQTIAVTVVNADAIAEQAAPTAASRPLPAAMPQQTPTAPKSSAPPLSPLLAQTARSDVAQQDSTAPLMAKLVSLQGEAARLPQPVLQAAQAVLASAIDVEAGPPSGEMLKQATLRSGVFFENALRSGTPVSAQQGDVKAALLQLRSAIMAWVGPNPAVPQPSNRRPAPPLRGTPPSSETTDLRAAAEQQAPKDVARQLLGQTDAAISRVRLFQLASLPDAPAAAANRAAPAEWNVELPLLLGHELCMAQFQVSRDGKSARPDQKRGWQMRFSMNFSALGQVGAQISLNGSAANVMLWADRPETSDAINQMLPELAPALAAKGLSPEGIFCRTGSPRQPMRPVGKFVDSLS